MKKKFNKDDVVVKVRHHESYYHEKYSLPIGTVVKIDDLIMMDDYAEYCLSGTHLHKEEFNGPMKRIMQCEVELVENLVNEKE